MQCLTKQSHSDTNEKRAKADPGYIAGLSIELPLKGGIVSKHKLGGSVT